MSVLQWIVAVSWVVLVTLAIWYLYQADRDRRHLMSERWGDDA